MFITKLFQLLLIFISFNQVIPATTKTTIDSNFPEKVNTHMQIYENDSIVTIFSHIKPTSKYDLNLFVSSLYKLSHPSISIKNILTTYDVKREIMLSPFLIFYHVNDAETVIQQFISHVNKRLHEFSNFYKTQCLNIVAKTDIQNVFDSFSVDDYYSTVEPDSPKSGNPPNTKEKKFRRKFKAAASAIILSTTAGFFSGDYLTPLSVAGEVLFESRNTDDTIGKNKNKNKVNISEIGMTPSEMWLSHAKIYCINTFAFNFWYEDGRITIVGDKIPYEFMRNFFSIVQHNIETMIAGLPDKTVKKRILENLLQRIEAIKLVSNKLEELVLFDLYTNLITIVETPFSNSLDIVMKYIEANVNELFKLEELLVIDFPITQMEVREQEQINLATKKINDRIKIEVANENAEDLADTVFTAEQQIHKNKVLNDIQNLEFDMLTKLYIYGPLKRTGILVSKTVLALPQGIAVGGLKGIYSFIGDIGGIVFFNPVTSMIIIFIGLSIVYTMVANSIQLIGGYCKWFYTIVSFPFYMGYKFVMCVRGVFL